MGGVVAGRARVVRVRVDVARPAVGTGPVAASLLVARMSRDELEATIRAQLTRVIAMTLQLDDAPPAATLNRATETILTAAEAYAAGDAEELTATRRAVLHRERDDWGGDTTVHTSPGTRGGVSRTASEPPRPPGSGALPQAVADGGATRSTRAPIPDAVTSGKAQLSTGVDGGYAQ